MSTSTCVPTRAASLDDDDTFLPGHQTVSTTTLDPRRDVIVERMRASAFFVGVREDTDVIETGVGHKAFELGEVLLRLAWEAHYQGCT